MAVKAGLAEVVVTWRGDRVPQGTAAEPARELAQRNLVLGYLPSRSTTRRENEESTTSEEMLTAIAKTRSSRDKNKLPVLTNQLALCNGHWATRCELPKAVKSTGTIMKFS